MTVSRAWLGACRVVGCAARSTCVPHHASTEPAPRTATAVVKATACAGRSARAVSDLRGCIERSTRGTGYGVMYRLSPLSTGHCVDCRHGASSESVQSLTPHSLHARLKTSSAVSGPEGTRTEPEPSWRGGRTGRTTMGHGDCVRRTTTATGQNRQNPTEFLLCIDHLNLDWP